MSQSGSDLSRYRRVLRYARPYRKGWAFLTLVALLNVPLALLQPWPMKIVVDNVLGGAALPEWLSRILAPVLNVSDPYSILGFAVVGSLVLFALASLSEIALTFGWLKVGQRMVQDFSRELFANVQRRSMVFHTRNTVGDLMNRIVYDSWCINSIADTLMLKPVQVFLSLGGMIWVMAQLDGGLTLASLVVAPFMASSSILLGRPVRTAAKDSLESAARMQAHVQQILSGLPVVQAFAQEERERQRFLEFANEAVRAEQRSSLAGSIYTFGSDLIVTLGTGAILWFGAQRVLAGHMSVGTLLVFLAYLASLLVQMRMIADLYRMLQRTGGSLDRVMEIIESPQEVPERPDAVALPPVKGHVQICEVSFGYKPGTLSLDRVSVEARPGDTVAVVGSTGAGKSTLVSLVGRFIDAEQGRVLIDGYDVRDVQLQSLRSQIAVVLQEPFLSSGTIAENIGYGRPDATREEIEAAARTANAHQFIEKLPEGYDSMLGERGATLSGGERQRLSIARALLKDAPILILDEPTSALDAQTEALLIEALERLMKGRTTFIVAHRLSTIRNANTIVVMQQGRVVETGRHEDLMERPGGIYRHLYELQFGQSAHE